MTNYANGDTGSDRAYEYEAERDGVADEAYRLFCQERNLDPDDDMSGVEYRIAVDVYEREMLARESLNHFEL